MCHEINSAIAEGSRLSTSRITECASVTADFSLPVSKCKSSKNVLWSPTSWCSPLYIFFPQDKCRSRVSVPSQRWGERKVFSSFLISLTSPLSSRERNRYGGIWFLLQTISEVLVDKWYLNSCYCSCSHGQGLLCLQLRADEAKGSIQWPRLYVKTAYNSDKSHCRGSIPWRRASLEEGYRPSPYFISENTIFVPFHFILCYLMLTGM